MQVPIESQKYALEGRHYLVHYTLQTAKTTLENAIILTK